MSAEKPMIYWHSSEEMPEVERKSVKLMIGASVYLGEKARWGQYEKLYTSVYQLEGRRILLDDGYLVVIQTDQYMDGGVWPRNALLTEKMLGSHFRLLDIKVWKRRAADFFQVPFSMVHVWGGRAAKKPSAVGNKEYFQGIWDYPQTKGGALNAYPSQLCELLVRTFTKPGDLIVDPFAGTARLLGIAHRMGRRAVGYEIDKSLKKTIKENLK